MKFKEWMCENIGTDPGAMAMSIAEFEDKGWTFVQAVFTDNRMIGIFYKFNLPSFK